MDDLLFLSRIREAAGDTPVTAATKVADLLRLQPELVVLDLDSQRVNGLEALEALRAEPTLAKIPVIGFFSHVHPERARAAEAAGCSRVVPRSSFLAELRRLLPLVPPSSVS